MPDAPPPRRRMHTRWRPRHRTRFVELHELVPYSRVTGLEHAFIAALRSMASQTQRRTAN